jgi:hypothetical protein
MHLKTVRILKIPTAKSFSVVVVGAMLKFSTRKFRIFGDTNAGSFDDRAQIVGRIFI